MNAFLYLSYFMIGLITLFGVLCLVAPPQNEWLPGNSRFAMSAVMFAYAALRYWRLMKWKKQQAANHE